MKKSLSGSLALLVVGLLFLFSIIFAQDVSSVVNANNQFAFELYSKYKSKDGNIFFSPYNISTALAMTYEGGRGKTADEIQSVFHFPKDDSLRRESFLKINNLINKKDKKYTLHTANALWAQKEYTFLEGYFNLIKNYYDGKATNLDFVNQTEKSRLTINSWVEEQTNDRIKDLIPQGTLGPLTRLVLTNAVYFKGFWLKQFDKKDTRDEDFRVGPGNTIKTPMMYLSGKEAEFNYGETEKLQILELPYKGQDLSMLIFLPKDDDLEAVEESLSAEKLSEWNRFLRREEVKVYLPKFKFEKEYFMKNTLKEMGMPTAFTLGIDFGGEADFSGMTGKKDLNIDEVIHKAFVEVNEEGTEAAAATAVEMKAGAAPGPSRIKVFKADHPFIFLIQEKETGNILFVGRVSDPTK
jgi:serpin B